jgi:hypothetical protein
VVGAVVVLVVWDVISPVLVVQRVLVVVVVAAVVVVAVQRVVGVLLPQAEDWVLQGRRLHPT